MLAHPISRTNTVLLWESLTVWTADLLILGGSQKNDERTGYIVAQTQNLLTWLDNFMYCTIAQFYEQRVVKHIYHPEKGLAQKVHGIQAITQ